MQKDLTVIVLAAGKGTRMGSNQAKVLHPLLGKPMICYVISAVAGLKPKRLIVVTGHQAAAVEAVVRSEFTTLIEADVLHFAHQAQQLGSGHAVWEARSAISEKTGIVLIINGDAPLLTTNTLRELLETRRRLKSTVAVMTFRPPSATGYGRIMHSSEKQILKIVEERDANQAEKALRECCVGVYAVEADKLHLYLKEIMREKHTAEYYITDLVTQAVRHGDLAHSYAVKDDHECLGINTPEDLRLAESVLAQKRAL